MDHILCRPLLRGGQLCCVEDIQPPEVHTSFLTLFTLANQVVPLSCHCVVCQPAQSCLRCARLFHIRLRSARTEVTCTKSVWQKVAWANWEPNEHLMSPIPAWDFLHCPKGYQAKWEISENTWKIKGRFAEKSSSVATRKLTRCYDIGFAGSINLSCSAWPAWLSKIREAQDPFIWKAKPVLINLQKCCGKPLRQNSNFVSHLCMGRKTQKNRFCVDREASCLIFRLRFSRTFQSVNYSSFVKSQRAQCLCYRFLDQWQIYWSSWSLDSNSRRKSQRAAVYFFVNPSQIADFSHEVPPQQDSSDFVQVISTTSALCCGARIVHCNQKSLTGIKSAAMLRATQHVPVSYDASNHSWSQGGILSVHLLQLCSLGQRRLKIRVTILQYTVNICQYTVIKCTACTACHYHIVFLSWFPAFLRPLAEVLWPGSARRSEPESKAARNLGHDSLKFGGSLRTVKALAHWVCYMLFISLYIPESPMLMFTYAFH